MAGLRPARTRGSRAALDALDLGTNHFDPPGANVSSRWPAGNDWDVRVCGGVAGRRVAARGFACLPLPAIS